MLFTSERTHSSTTLGGTHRGGRGTPPFLAIRHVSRVHQGNYGVNRSKCLVPLVKLHISTRSVTAWRVKKLLTSRTWRGFTRPRQRKTSRSVVRNFVGGGLIKQPAQDWHTYHNRPLCLARNILEGENNSNSKTAKQTCPSYAAVPLFTNNRGGKLSMPMSERLFFLLEIEC